MKVLAFMQNQWFRNPAAVQAMLARHPNKRNELIKRLLFAGCLSGKRLRAALGDLCDKIVWEEANPGIADHSAGSFAADHQHMKNAIEFHHPDAIICFGKIAGDAVRKLKRSEMLFFTPHPAARGNTVQELNNLKRKLQDVLQTIEKVDLE